MLVILTKAAVGSYRSINTSQSVAIDPNVTVLVGMNEAGKTVFLKALHKSNDALGAESFNPTDDIHVGILRPICASMRLTPRRLWN